MSSLNKMTVEDIDCRGKKVLCRVDFNVPLDDRGCITDETRVVAALPTLRHLLDQGARLILASHLGRPKGKPDPKYSLAPVAPLLSNRLERPVVLAPDCVGEEVARLVGEMADGDVLLLENVRFHAEETANDRGFSQKLAGLADIYVNDAFGTAHRAHASTEGVAHFLSPAVAGFLMEKEIKYLGNALANPERPLVAILGGAKVSDKISVIQNLLDKVDALLIGGGMAYTFLKARGIEIGRSLVEDDRLDLAAELIDRAEKAKVPLLLPSDHVVAAEFKADADHKVVDNGNFPETWMGLDIGPETVRSFSDRISSAGTVVWNGPMGVFEFPSFAEGTFAVARALADSKALSIIGGGDSVAAVTKAGLADRITHISTGGGASLEFLEGKVLPGIAALTDKN